MTHTQITLTSVSRQNIGEKQDPKHNVYLFEQMFTVIIQHQTIVELLKNQKFVNCN